MGMFPYECMYCGGGFSRCGQNHPDCGCGDCDDPEKCPTPTKCKGGQFCWEDACVVFPYENEDEDEDSKSWQTYTGVRFVGTYDGYGRVTSDLHPKKQFYPVQFSEHFENWFDDETDKSKVLVVGSICCKSCYDDHNEKKTNKRKGSTKGAAKTKAPKSKS